MHVLDLELPYLFRIEGLSSFSRHTEENHRVPGQVDHKSLNNSLAVLLRSDTNLSVLPPFGDNFLQLVDIGDGCVSRHHFNLLTEDGFSLFKKGFHP